MSNEDLKNLEQRVDQLIRAVEELKSENSGLRTEKKSLEAEHAQLLDKTQRARARIETMIDRLKTLERSE